MAIVSTLLDKFIIKYDFELMKTAAKSNKAPFRSSFSQQLELFIANKVANINFCVIYSLLA